jgi:hypothetical protein
VDSAPRLHAPMPEPYAATLATVAAGRTALVAHLRTIAARVEALPTASQFVARNVMPSSPTEKPLQPLKT